MDIFAGIDVGSLSTDCVIINEKEEILSYSITETGASSTEAAEKSLEEALARLAVQREAVKNLVATGYGRISVPFADKKVTEISCHASLALLPYPSNSSTMRQTQSRLGTLK